MFQDITKPPPPLPAVELKPLDAGISVLSPLVRRGTGPPLIILAADNDDSTSIVEGVPSLLIKWAEEGYMVAEIQRQALEKDAAGTLKRSIEALRESSKCEPKDKIGLVGKPSPRRFVGPIAKLTVSSVRASIVEPSCRCCKCYLRYQIDRGLGGCFRQSRHLSLRSTNVTASSRKEKRQSDKIDCSDRVPLSGRGDLQVRNTFP